MSNIRRDINNTRWKRHGHWPVMKFKRVSTFKPSSCSTVGMLACFWRHQFNRVILMIRTSWRGKRLWNLSIVRIRDYPPAYWFFAWTHIFFPRDLLVQVRKNIYVAKEKKKEKKKEQFSQHVSQEGTNCNLKIQHLFSSLSDCYNLSIILSVFKLQEKDTRKEKRRGTRSYLFLDPGLDCKDCRNTLERNKMVGQRQPWLPREVMAEESR